MDATANELEHTKINSFPTIKLFKKDTNEVSGFRIGFDWIATMLLSRTFLGIPLSNSPIPCRFDRHLNFCFVFSKVVDYNGERTLEGLTKFLDTDGEYGRAAPDQVCISEPVTNLILSSSLSLHTFHTHTHCDLSTRSLTHSMTLTDTLSAVAHFPNAPARLHVGDRVQG